jgi:hypothetical protein
LKLTDQVIAHPNADIFSEKPEGPKADYLSFEAGAASLGADKKMMGTDLAAVESNPAKQELVVEAAPLSAFETLMLEKLGELTEEVGSLRAEVSKLREAAALSGQGEGKGGFLGRLRGNAAYAPKVDSSPRGNDGGSKSH